MRHFEIVHWADFVRGVAASDLESSMRTHLENGCVRCDGVVRRLNAVAATAATDAALPPPESLHRFTTAVLLLHSSLRRPSAPAPAPPLTPP